MLLVFIKLSAFSIVTDSSSRSTMGTFYSSGGYASIVKEDSESYAYGWKKSNQTVDEYTYQTSDDLDGYLTFAKLDVYSGGGYVYRLRGSRAHLTSEMSRLEHSNWIDGQTRAIVVEFSVYNAQANLFGVISIIAELFPTGGLIPSFSFDVIRLLRYHQNFGVFILISELVALLAVFAYTYREAKLILRLGKTYFSGLWNLVEIFNLLMSYAAIAVYACRHWLTGRVLDGFSRHHGLGYIKLQGVKIVDEVLGYLTAVVVFVCILKVGRLTQVNKRMNMLHETLAHLRKDLRHYGMMFCFVFFAFVQLFYLVFGSSVHGFSSVATAAETTASIMLGKFNFHEMHRSAPFLGPALFFVFSVASKFVLLNLLLTMIITAFRKVKSKPRPSDELQLVDFVWAKLSAWIGFHSAVDVPKTAPNRRTFSLEHSAAVMDKFVALADRVHGHL